MTLTACKCDTCGVETLSIKGTHHRRCPGNTVDYMRPKRDKLPSAKRGKWQ